MRHRFPILLLLLAALCMVFPASAGATEYLYVPVSNALQIIDCSTDMVVKTLPDYNDFIGSATYSPDGKRYYACGWHTIYVFDTAKNELIDTIRLSTDLNRVTLGAVAVSIDGGKMYMATSIVKRKLNVPRLNVLPPQLVVFDLKSKSIAASYEIPIAVSGIFPIRTDPDHLILLGLDVYKFSLKDGKVEKVMGMLNPDKGGEVRNCMLNNVNGSPGDNGLVALAYYTTQQTPPGMGYLIIDTNTGKVSTVKAEDVFFAYSCRVSPDKKYIYVVLDQLIKVDMKTGKTVAITVPQEGTYTALAVTADGKKVYAGPYGPDITVYDAETLKPLGVIELEADGRAANIISR